MKHNSGESCSCSPTVIPVERLDYSMGWVYAHKEPEQTPEEEASRLLCILEAIEDVKNDY